MILVLSVKVKDCLVCAEQLLKFYCELIIERLSGSATCLEKQGDGYAVVLIPGVSIGYINFCGNLVYDLRETLPA